MKMEGSLKVAAALFIVAIFIVPAAAASADDTEEVEIVGFTSYYDQLDANGKAIYDALNDADAYVTEITVDLPVVLSAKSDTTDEAKGYLTDMVADSVNGAFQALWLSSPMAYWAWFSNSVRTEVNSSTSGDTVTVSSVTFKISFGKYPSDFPGIPKMLDDLNAAVNKFHTDHAYTDKTSKRDKVMDINNYLTELVTYDPDIGKPNESRYSHDAYGALVDPKHYAVCDGYSEAFLLLCQKEGIECIIVYGTALSSMEFHAWNYVKMDDGKWYAIDVTWNDGGDNAYFLLGADTFFQTHHQGEYLKTGQKPYDFKSPPLSGTQFDVPPADYSAVLIWLAAIAIVALFSFALYRYAKKGV